MYNLVTTSLEDTWDRCEENLFLGEWCIDFNRTEVREDYNWVKFQRKTRSRSELIDIQIYTNRIKDELLSELSTFLNEYHKTDFEWRHWNIILGHWLTRYVDTLYDRFFTIEEVLKENFNLKTIVYDEDGFEFQARDTAHFTVLCNNDIWNHQVYRDILVYLEFDEFTYIKNNRESNIELSNNKTSVSLNSFIKKSLNLFSSFFSQNADIFISTTYLPWKYELFLQLKLKQVPGYWNSPEIRTSTKTDKKTRSKSLSVRSKDLFESYIYGNVLKFLPKIYLESFMENWTMMESLRWPKRPRIVFISNNFDTNEIYKFYIVKNLIKNDTIYVVGQHGAHYGTTFQYINYPEYSSSDYFFTWGWSYTSKDLRAFNFKTSTRFNRYNFKYQRDILLVQLPILHRNVVWDTFEYQSNYQDDQFKLLRNLSSDGFESIRVRLHHEHVSSPWKEKERFLYQFPNVKFSNDNLSVLDLYLGSKLVVHSYDSTGVLECLSMNVPMIAFWTNEVYRLNDNALRHYHLLRDVGIFYDCPIKAADFINSVGDILAWWNKREIQQARLKFCAEYSNFDKHPVLTLQSHLTSILKSHGH